MKKKICLCITIIFTLFLILIYPSIYQNQSKNRVYSDIKSKLSDYKSANISIIKVEENENDGISYGVGSSGVIINKRDNIYYALTAYHVIKQTKGTSYLVMNTDNLLYAEYKKEHKEEHIPLEEYYEQFPACDIIYSNEKSDIAIVKFESEQELNIVSISNSVPTKGTRLVCIGTEGENNTHFVETYGKVLSDKLATFKTSDGQSDNKVIKHNAYECPGFSGGAVLNENMELIGINIGGTTDLFGRFLYGVMIPSDQIKKCISESKIME